MATWQKLAFDGAVSYRTLNWDLTATSKHGAKYGYINAMNKASSHAGSYTPFSTYFKAIPFCTSGFTPFDNIDQDGAAPNRVSNWHDQEDLTGVDESAAYFDLASTGNIDDMIYDGDSTYDDYQAESLWDSVITVPNGGAASKKHIFNLSGWMTNQSSYVWNAAVDGHKYIQVQIWRAYVPGSMKLGGNTSGPSDPDDLRFRLVKRSVLGAGVKAPSYSDQSHHFVASEVVLNLDGNECVDQRASYYMITWFISDSNDLGEDATSQVQWPQLAPATSLNSNKIESHMSVSVSYAPGKFD